MKKEIQFTLQKTYGNKAVAAKLLGISRATLYNKLKKYKLYKEVKTPVSHLFICVNCLNSLDIY
ncbi:helix-turn-helix domain-containing protein [Alkalihalobacillus deserti]|uniref:helix-turn-helix domain-containing protein n=1 Tax=Alkalihalobacillus deserti TaxID=2879466 RepID=UPI001D14E130